MKHLIHYFPIISLLLVLSSCGDDKSAQQQAAAQQSQAYPVTTVSKKTVTAYTQYPASIEGIVNSEVRAKVSGYITKVLVDEGQKVKKGQVLFKLETQSLDQDADAAKANVNAAQVEVNRLKPLVEKNIISDVQLETAKAKLKQAQSNLNSILANIGYANIKSPVDGYVGSIRLRQGALISPSDQMPLTTISDISKIYAYFSMNESDYISFMQNTNGEDTEARLKNMPKVNLILANGDTYAIQGEIQAINSQVSSSTGAVSFRAIFDNPNRILNNGNSGKVEIPQTYENTIVVPQISTFEQQGSTLVYKLGDSSKVTTARLQIEDQTENLYVVKSGIKEGDTIVAEGAGNIRPNSKIKPQMKPFDSIAKPIDQVFR